MMRTLPGLLLTCLLLTGCLERRETLTVARDGSLTMEATFEGPVGEFNGAALLPSREGGWAVEQEEREKGDDTERTVRARQRFAADQWPESFASGDDVEVGLRFPTELTIERRRDGVYYHFVRVYEPRQLQRYKRHQEIFSKVWEEKFGELEFAEADPKTQKEAVGLLRDYELGRQLEYVEAGLAEVEEDWPLDLQLDTRAAFRRAYLTVDLDSLVELLNDETGDEDIEAVAAATQEEARENMATLLKQRGRRRAEVDRFFAAIDREERVHKITEDLADETFEVSLNLPGEVVAHDGRLEGNTVIWGFLGEGLMDRRQILRATSRLRR